MGLARGIENLHATANLQRPSCRDYLQNLLEMARPNQSLKLEVKRKAGGKTETVTVKLAELTDVVKTTIYVACPDRADLVTAWNVVSRHFGTHMAPSTLLGVTVLGYPDQLVEVEAVAALR